MGRSSSTGIGLVLVYHRVASVEFDPWGLSVTPDHFEQQLEVILRCARPATLDDLARGAIENRILPRTVAITFDDGYSDNLNAAEPMLAARDLPATIFLSTGYIEERREFWWDELEQIVMTRAPLPDELELAIGAGNHRWQIDGSERLSLFMELWEAMRRLDHPERESVFRSLWDWAGRKAQVRDSHRPLTTDEVRRLAGNPLIEIGAHTRTHPVLALIPNARQKEDVLSSRTWLEDVLGRPVRSFAYPFGQPADYTAVTVDILRENGFSAACTTVHEVVRPGCDPIQIPRFQVNDWDGDRFEQELNGWLGDGLVAERVRPARPADVLLRVDRPARRAEGTLVDGGVDSPESGRLVPIDTEITGWVRGTEAAVEALEVEVDGKPVQRELVQGYRADVAGAHPGEAGAMWSGFRFLLTPPDGSQWALLTAVLADGRRSALAGLRTYAVPAPTEQPLVSVIVPCYNQAHYLPEAIESLLSQTYSRVEIIVVDDGSSDNTVKVAARYPEVRCVRQANQGLAGARNAGFEASTGELVVFLDADDRLLPVALSIGVSQLIAHPSWSFVSGNYRTITVDGSELDVPPPACVEGSSFEELLRRNYIAMCATVVYRRKAIARAGGFDESLKACEDYDLYLRVARSDEVGCHETVVAEYRQHGVNMSRRAGLMLKTAMRALDKQRPYLTGSREREAAKEGARFARRWFGNPLLRDLGAELRAGDWTQVPADLWIVLRYYPLGLPALMMDKLKAAAYRKPLAGVRAAVSGLLEAPKAKPALQTSAPLLPRRVTPVSDVWGFDRGLPVDRYYIEQFLNKNRDIRGRVLEVGDNAYTMRFGRGVEVSDILNNDPAVEGTTIVDDLNDSRNLPKGAFDCIVVTQTLHLIYDTRAALRALHASLAPGGVLLLTVPGLTRTSQTEWSEAWYWMFTRSSIARLLVEEFGPANVRVELYGNVLSASAFLYGLAAHELTEAELQYNDPSYQVILAARVVNASSQPEV